MVQWNSTLSRELHKSKRKRFRRRKVISLTPDEIWAADLCDLRRYKSVNKQYVYLLMVIDVFSKYAWVVPLRNKTGAVVANALDRLFTDNKKAPSKLWTDFGKEFYNRDVDQVLKSHHVSLYSTFNEEKSCIVERFNRTFLNWLYIYFDTHQHTFYLPIIKDLVLRYNDTRHRSIGCTPLDARKPENYQKVYDNLYPNDHYAYDKPKFHVGDKVR